MKLQDENAILQRLVNETQSLMGYGTASEPKDSG